MCPVAQHITAVSEFRGKTYCRDHGMHQVLADNPGPGKKREGSGIREASVVEFI